ncbi:MAG TPA: ABC transporter ATP-binding protein [Thermoplasmata archaeon]|nr:ABC transporter ATP-binding protein [Thermoplasmata archaeon]
MTGPSIEARGLTKHFGNFTALDDLRLNMVGAKCVGFLGPNGAGKTTALKMLTDMIFPSKGEAFLNGVSVRMDRKAALAQAGVLIESPEIYPSLSPREALDMVGDLRGMSRSVRRERTMEVLAEVKMEEWADQKVGRFSKGMKQRVNIAAALLHDPQILLLDEPATGLDPRGMAEVRDILRGLKRRNRLIFMSSHILAEVTDVCDEVALINKGRLIFYDTLANVTAKFAHGNTAVDVAFARPVAEPAVAGPLGAVPGFQRLEVLDPRRVRVYFDGRIETQEKLADVLGGLHLGMTSFAESKSALEEIYLSQIERGD